MSALFYVSVLDKDEKKNKIDFSLTIINPDQRSFYNTKSFALLLILDPLHDPTCKNPVLFDEIPLKDIINFNLNLVKKKESKIVKKADLHDIGNFPLPPDLATAPDNVIRKFWANKEHLPKAVLSVVVKNPKYISHLQKGMSWESGAFNII